MEYIKRIQYQAVLFITGTWKGTKRNKLYDGFTPRYFSDILTSQTSITLWQQPFQCVSSNFMQYNFTFYFQEPNPCLNSSKT